MSEANCVFPQCGVARHHVGAGIFKLPTRKACVTMKTYMIQKIEKRLAVEEKLERIKKFSCL